MFTMVLRYKNKKKNALNKSKFLLVHEGFLIGLNKDFIRRNLPELIDSVIGSMILKQLTKIPKVALLD